MEILHRDDLLEGGFAGLKEHRLVTDTKAFGERKNVHAWEGLGSFVYLADARFLPKGETKLHSHKEIDVISVMVSGNIAHEGSLENGQSLGVGDIQAQRAGGEGFSHNEINPDNQENRMIQLWALPERAGECAGYKVYQPTQGETARVYGGSVDQDETFDSSTLIDVSLLNKGQQLELKGEFLAYVTQGAGVMGDAEVKDGDLIRSQDDMNFNATENTQIIVIYQTR